MLICVIQCLQWVEDVIRSRSLILNRDLGDPVVALLVVLALEGSQLVLVLHLQEEAELLVAGVELWVSQKIIEKTCLRLLLADVVGQLHRPHHDYPCVVFSYNPAVEVAQLDQVFGEAEAPPWSVRLLQQQGFQEGERSDPVEFKFEEGDDLCFGGLELGTRVGVGSDVGEVLEAGRIDFLVFAGHPETSYSHQLVLLLEDGVARLVLFEVGEGQEQSLVLQLEVLLHVHQPIHQNLPHYFRNLCTHRLLVELILGERAHEVEDILVVAVNGVPVLNAFVGLARFLHLRVSLFEMVCQGSAPGDVGDVLAECSSRLLLSLRAQTASLLRNDIHSLTVSNQLVQFQEWTSLIFILVLLEMLLIHKLRSLIVFNALLGTPEIGVRLFVSRLSLQRCYHLVLSAQDDVFLFKDSHEPIALLVEALDFLGQLRALEVELVLQVGDFFLELSVFCQQHPLLSLELVYQLLPLEGQIDVLALQELLQVSDLFLILPAQSDPA